MPSLAQSLEGKDLGHIHMVAELWGIELQARDALEAIQQLSGAILNEELVLEVVEALPDEAREALSELLGHRGRLPWDQFMRRYGEVRTLGAARREKERVHRKPISSSEWLWYRGLVGRAFFDSGDGPREFAYVPDDLLKLMPAPSTRDVVAFGRAALPAEYAQVTRANDRILDEACTLLAGRRLGLEIEELELAEEWLAPPKTLAALLQNAGIMDEAGQPIPEATRKFLEAERGKALLRLAQAWLQGEGFDELRWLPGLKVEGQWRNEAQRTRQRVLSFSKSAPTGKWWSLPALIADVREREPDFQRQGGDYDSWYVRDVSSGAYLRGFEYWNEVEGALIAYIVSGPLYWLGMVDIGTSSGSDRVSAFRLTAWADGLFAGEAPKGLPAEEDKLKVDSQGLVQVAQLGSRALRYQIARFCTWEGKKKDAYRYRVRAASLERAREQGLEVRQLLGLLKAHSVSPLPPNLREALLRWEKQGRQARIGEMLVLRVSSAALLKALRASHAGRYLGEPLGPTAIEVNAGAKEQVIHALAELGYLAEFDGEMGED